MKPKENYIEIKIKNWKKKSDEEKQEILDDVVRYLKCNHKDVKITVKENTKEEQRNGFIWNVFRQR